MNLKEFGLYLAKIREQSGFKSQRQLALASGISNGTIARIESGTQKPTPETLKTLSKYLRNVTYEELMKRAGYMNFEAFQEKVNEVDQFLGSIDLSDKEIINRFTVVVDGKELTEEEMKRLIHFIRVDRAMKQQGDS